MFTYKKIVIVLLLLTLSAKTFSIDKKVDKRLKYWEINTIGITNDFGLDVANQYKKQIRSSTFTMDRISKNKVLYFVAENHIGFSKVFLNGELLGTLGSINDIKDNTKIVSENLVILDAENFEKSTNNIVIESYFNGSSSKAIYSITSRVRSPIFTNMQNRLKETIPVSFTLITLVFLIISFLNPIKESKNFKYYFTQSLILFIIYFLISGLRSDGVFTNNLTRFSRLFYLFAWMFFVRFYLLSNRVWDIKKISIVGFILMTTILSTSIITQYNYLIQSITFTESAFMIIINVMFLRILYNNKIENESVFRAGILVSLILHILDFVLYTVYSKPVFGILQIAAFSAIISYNLSLARKSTNKLHNSEIYSKRLVESIEKTKKELLKKEDEIANLKSTNEEVIRDKSLFFTALGNNLRTPLNSIIGFSENLYSAKSLEEVHGTVDDIIIESDKIFQSINNVMDFSTRSVPSSDLVLKDFRMKEIFTNSVFESSILTSFSKNINYKVIGDCDKVIIHGNPIIYKQILTNVLHFLIELYPKEIDYTITDNGIGQDFMNLVVKFTAKNRENTALSQVSSLSNYRDIFTKYIKLYNVDFTEEVTDELYTIDLRFQCGLSKNREKQSQKEMTSNLILTKTLRVMVVDDYNPNLTIVKMHLLKMGCDVITATNGEEAVDIFARNSVDVILMDIKMPIMDGWEATELIRSTEKGLDTYIIGLTASSLDLDIRHCFESGMDDVQVKPIRKKQLYNKLNTLEKLKPVTFPTVGSLRAELCVSKIETETLYSTSISQIEKQLEVIEVLCSAKDDPGVAKEMPAIIHASININAFYYSRLLRNFFNAYTNRETMRVEQLLKQLKDIIKQSKETYAHLFRN